MCSVSPVKSHASGHVGQMCTQSIGLFPLHSATLASTPTAGGPKQKMPLQGSATHGLNQAAPGPIVKKARRPAARGPTLVRSAPRAHPILLGSRRAELQHARVKVVWRDGEDKLLECLHHLGAALDHLVERRQVGDYANYSYAISSACMKRILHNIMFESRVITTCTVLSAGQVLKYVGCKVQYCRRV